MLVCTAIIQPPHIDCVIQLINQPELVGKRFWILWLITHLDKTKYRKAILETLVVISIAIASGVTDPSLLHADCIAVLKTRSAG